MFSYRRRSRVTPRMPDLRRLLIDSPAIRKLHNLLSFNNIHFSNRKCLWLLPLALLLAGCSVKHYQAQPILPAQSAATFQSRSFSDPALRAFMDRNLSQHVAAWPLSTWDLQQLSLAALYFNPAMDTARARLAEA